MELKGNPGGVPASSQVDTILHRLQRQTGLDVTARVSVSDLARLIDRASGDDAWLERALLRRFAGEPLPYVLGELEFGGRVFIADKRAYITDPEAIWLIRVVEREVRSFHAVLGRWPVVAELGFGGGALGISLKLACPGIDLVGLDLDDDTLAVGAGNAARHGVDVELVASNLFASWPRPEPPDLVFSDPPWGGEEDLYDEVRDASYYHAMPSASAYPVGGRTAVHRQLLTAVAERGWSSQLILNAGVLPESELSELTGLMTWFQVEHPAAGLTVLHASLRARP